MIDVILTIVYLMLAAAVGAVIFSVIRSNSSGDRMLSVSNGIPVGKILVIQVVATVAVLCLTFALGSSNTLTVNGKPYGEWFWLKIADMFIYTSALMLAVALALAVYGFWERRRGNV